jgi:LysM repeat protein
MKAVQKFDPDKGIRLISYAVWWIRAYIQNYILKSWSLVKLGTTQAQRKLFFSLARTKRELDKMSAEHGFDSDGENAAKIAKKLKVNRIDLAEANYLSSRSGLNTGQRLIIPRAPALLLASLPDNPAPVVEGRPAAEVVAAKNIAPEVPAKNIAPQVAATSAASLIYRVKRGDTLFSIAKLFRTTVASVKSWNGLRSNSIRVGQRLTIFTDEANATN